MSEPFHRPGLRVAVMGHARHGKSALVAALRARASARVGAPIEWTVLDGPAPPARPQALRAFTFDGAERAYDGVDLAGHRRLVRHAGVVASAVDVCLLVISAVEGVMAQTREHALLARQLSGGQVVVFINRCDEVTDPEQLDLAEMEARQLLYDVGFDGDGAAVVRGAADAPPALRGLWSPALDALLAALDHGVLDVPRDADGALWATVLHRWRRASTVGPVVHVSVRHGSIAAGDRVLVVSRDGAASGARVEGVRTARSGGALSTGELGTVALRPDRARPRSARFPRMGDAIIAAGVALRTASLTVRLRLLAPSEGGRRTPIRSGHTAGVWICGRLLTVRVRLPPGVEMMAPGASRDDVVLALRAPTLAPPGAGFVLYAGSDERGEAQRGGCFATGEVLAAAP